MGAMNKVVTVGEVNKTDYHQSVNEKVPLHIAINSIQFAGIFRRFMQQRESAMWREIGRYSKTKTKIKSTFITF